ncbi:MAG: hypothetical protein P1U58_18020 [Verrucomicrobiales bacterium]|nr:hypothetical protein [Verrucomicrobiales bacterium]
MKVLGCVVLLVVALSGCSEPKERFWGYEFELPSEFIPVSTDVGGEWHWRTEGETLEVGHVRFSKERSKFSNLEEFADWIGNDSGIERPSFRRTPNGLDVAVDAVETWTQIAIAFPENTDYWEILLFGISPAEPDDREARLLRERAIGAILSGRPTRN